MRDRPWSRRQRYPASVRAEVGSGTGLLTTALLARGFEVDAVEPGTNMIRVAEQRVGPAAAVRFHRGRFEEVALPERTFGAVFSATAFHWIEPEIGWARAARLLKPGAVLALLQYCEVSDPSTVDDWRALAAALDRVAPDIGARMPELRDADTAHTEMTGEQLNAYLRTTSLYRRLTPEQRPALEAENRAAVERAGGFVRGSQLAVLVTGRRA